jgi:diguanylate cyclase (GGDEF)-like protein/PAS domain S-box-containing protein
MTKNEHWLDKLIESSYIGIIVVDKERNNLFVNDYLCELFGYTREFLLSTSVRIFHKSEESFNYFSELVFNTVLQGKPLSIDYQFKRKDGSLLWAHVSGDFIEESNEVLWSVVENTHEIEMQEKMNKLNERMELALLGNHDGVWDVDILKNELYISPRCKEIVGIEDNESIFDFAMWEKLIHPDDLDRAQKLLTKRFEEHLSTSEEQYRFIKPDGTIVWVKAKAKSIFDKSGKLIRIVGTYSDITDEKEREFEEKRLAQMLEQTNDAIISTDLEGYIKSWNHGAEQLFGYTKKEIIGKHLLLLDPDNNLELFQARSQKLAKLGELHIENDALSKEGKIIRVATSYTLVRDVNDNVTGIIGYALDITKRVKAENELKEQKSILNYQAHHDSLTDLANRALFSDRLAQSIEKAKRRGTIIALLFIDLDRFKEINDSLGHSVGDEILQIIALRLKESIRDEDSVARLGGDEFTVILEDLQEVQDASLVGMKLLDALSKPIHIKEHTLYVSSSIGISIYPNDSHSAEDLLKYADAAMYRAKNEGRNNYQFYSKEMTEEAIEIIIMETRLREALVKEEFLVYYQPQVDARNDTITGMEALVRWKHPKKGLLSPDKFIAIAESLGLLVAIDRYVMKSAMEQFSKWKKMGLNPGRLSLNLTISHLNKSDFMEVFENLLEKSGCSANHLELEVVESEIMQHPEKSIKRLNLIRDLGVSISVDDFGTGYSSLSYLKKLPIKKLKIDKSFIDNLPENEDDVVITKAVIALAKSLNLDIIAEGVEVVAQKKFLLANGCYNIQGYYYSKPLPSNEMQELLKNGLQIRH